MSELRRRAMAQARESAAAAMASALEQIRGLIPMVARNNPNREFTWVLGRADVAAAVSAARDEMTASGIAAITAAYQSTFDQARLEAVQTLAELGVEPDWTPAEENVYLAQLIDKWQASSATVFTSLYGRMSAAVARVQPRPTLTQDPVNGVSNVYLALGQDKQAALEAVLDEGIRSLGFRAGVGASSAAAKAAGDALEAMVPPAADNVRLLKRWRVSGLPGTCIYCRQLDGVTVPVGSSFPVVGPLPVFGGALSGPPRHPNCRCWLQLIQEDLAAHAISQLELFPAASAAAGKRPATPPPLPPVVSISAEQIRKMPRKTYNSVVASLLRTIRGFLGQQWKRGTKWLGF